jgi:uncharacterized protein (DUF2141 family)
MKVVLLLFFSVLTFYSSAFAQGKVEAQVTNFSNSKGVCRACLFNTESSFNGKEGKAVQCVQVPVSNKTAKVTFENIPPGNYAVSVFHDVNNNNKLDVNFLGIPKEGYGASKNKLPFAAAPAFADNLFTVKANAVTSLSIRLRNL